MPQDVSTDYPEKRVAAADDLPAAHEGWDATAERRVLWKVDLLLMPILTFSYGLQFVSTRNLSLPGSAS